MMLKKDSKMKKSRKTYNKAVKNRSTTFRWTR